MDVQGPNFTAYLSLVKDLAPRAEGCGMKLCVLSLIYETRISLFLKLQCFTSDLINFAIL